MSILDTFEYDHTDLNTVDQRMNPHFSRPSAPASSRSSSSHSSTRWMLDQSAIGSMINDEEEMESEEEKPQAVSDDVELPLPVEEEEEPAPSPKIKQRKPAVATKRKPKKVAPLPADTYDDIM